MKYVKVFVVRIREVWIAVLRMLFKPKWVYDWNYYKHSLEVGPLENLLPEYETWQRGYNKETEYITKTE